MEVKPRSNHPLVHSCKDLRSHLPLRGKRVGFLCTSQHPGDKGDAQRMLVDTELEHLPAELRWREWMGRVEAVEYRAKWSLPADYPMVAPNYAAARSALAKTMGLGRKPKEPEKPAPAKRPRKKATA